MSLQRGPDLKVQMETLVGRRRPALLRAAGKILHDPDQAEDVVQDTLAAVWQRMGAAAPRNLEGYLFAAVRRNALKRLARRRPSLPLDGVAPAGAEPPEGEEIDALTLEQAIMQLPLPQQAVIRMKYYTGLTFRQVGQALAISVNTAASRCRYALATMRTYLKRRGIQGPERSRR